MDDSKEGKIEELPFFKKVAILTGKKDPEKLRENLIFRCFDSAETGTLILDDFLVNLELCLVLYFRMLTGLKVVL